jgi:hypothetical protein
MRAFVAKNLGTRVPEAHIWELLEAFDTNMAIMQAPVEATR